MQSCVAIQIERNLADHPLTRSTVDELKSAEMTRPSDRRDLTEADSEGVVVERGADVVANDPAPTSR